MPSSLKPALRALLGASAAALALAAPATAAPVEAPTIQATDASRSTCENPSLGTPYAALGDERSYVLAPGGSFEDPAAPGWQLSGGAAIDHDARQGGQLVLPAGASAVSPSMCIDLDYPHLRFAHKVLGRHAKHVAIQVDVVYPQTATGWISAGRVAPFASTPVGAGWRVSPDVALHPELGGTEWGARDVALRFTAVKTGATGRRVAPGAQVRVDDVFIDPRARF